MSHEETTAASGVFELDERAFWIVFWGAWACYAILFISAEILQGVAWGSAVLVGTLAVGTLALPSVPLARRRRRLIPPDVKVSGFLKARAVEAVLYATVASTLMSLLFSFVEMPHELNADAECCSPVAWTVNSLFLYAVLTAFLTGSEALRRLNETRALAAREAILRAEAEAKALRAQFNPHFVFNTLHSLMVLIRGEPETAERAIEDVAELIRYASTIQRQGVDQVTLHKELNFARRYLALEQLRLDDRLEVSWQVEPGLDNALVPAFGLQTLLENAINHGIAPKPEGGRVQIKVDRSEEHLHFEVRDDGLGADPETVIDNDGQGLRLLERRLETTYGTAASLTWETRRGEGFRATIHVPLRWAPGI